ncbi:MAG: hypothetical protein IKV85_03090 [Ruminococcus sp.]|nr:hypothetical protein [Ruminococcus sp.]
MQKNQKGIIHIYLFSFLNYVGILITVVMSGHQYNNIFDSIATIAIPIIQFFLIFATSSLYDYLSSNKLQKNEKFVYYILSVIMAFMSMIGFWFVWIWKLKDSPTHISNHEIINRIMNPLLFPLGIILSEILPLDTGMGKLEKEIERVKSKFFKAIRVLKDNRKITIPYVLITILVSLLIAFFLIYPVYYNIIEVVCDILAVIVLFASLVILIKKYVSK